MNVLVVAAHPDDEILGAGGTIARHTSRGETVYAVLLGEGITSRAEEGGAPPGAGVRELKQDAREAASIVGIEQTFFPVLLGIGLIARSPLRWHRSAARVFDEAEIPEPELTSVLIPNHVGIEIVIPGFPRLGRIRIGLFAE